MRLAFRWKVTLAFTALAAAVFLARFAAPL